MKNETWVVIIALVVTLIMFALALTMHTVHTGDSELDTGYTGGVTEDAVHGDATHHTSEGYVGYWWQFPGSEILLGMCGVVAFAILKGILSHTITVEGLNDD